MVHLVQVVGNEVVAVAGVGGDRGAVASCVQRNVQMASLSVIGSLICLAVALFSAKLIAPTFRLMLGTLYPAYASYKAVRTKDVKEYVSILRLFHWPPITRTSHLSPL